MNNGNAQTSGKSVTAEMFEFHEPSELRDFRFPTDAVGAIGYRVTRIEREVEDFRVLPFFADDGLHNLSDEFLNTEVIRIIVYR